MLLDDALCNRKSQTGSGAFAGEERLEDQRQILIADAGSVVGNCQPGVL